MAFLLNVCLWPSSIGLTWELVRNVEFQVSPQNYRIRLFTNKIPR